LVSNAADPAQVGKAREREREQEHDARADLSTLMGQAYGRRIVWRLLGECGVFRSSFHTSGSTVYFLEGRRDVGLRLMADVLQAAPEAYLLMQSEAKNNPITGG
jgi:hypothetical protein